MKRIIKSVEHIMEFGGIKKDIVFLILSGVSLLISLLDKSFLPFDLAWVAIILCGVPIILEAIIGLVTEFDVKADVLVSLALVASICIGEDFAAGEVAFIMQLGALLEDLTVAKARAGIERLVRLTPVTARIVTGNKEKIIPAKNVRVGDILKVLPGESIPVDGVITAGQTSIDQSVMTGEPLPADKTVGDNVSSGTVNRFGSFEMKAVKIGEDSSIQRMIKLVKSADAGKAKIVGIADRWATWIVIIALTAALFTWVITGEIIRAVTILVVFCPCALVLATPTAIMAAIGNATKHGFLVREGDALERLSAVTTIVFDKTGTLTYGKPQVVKAESLSKYSSEDIYKFAACVEQYSEHPLGKAIVNSYTEEKKDLIYAENFKMIPGQGASATVDKKMILAGNSLLFAENSVVLGKDFFESAKQYFDKGCTVVYIAIDNQAVGYIVLSDTLRRDSVNMIDDVKNIGVKPVLLTGDNENSARSIGSELHIKDIYSNCLPENKLAFIDECQNNKQFVCMIGDGINDAPALKKADVGIAMGGIGSDIAVDAADIALVNDDVKELPHLLRLSKRMMITIKCNLTFSMILNFVAIILAVTGKLNPIVGALVHNAGSVLVIINSAVLLKWRKRKCI